MRFLSFGFALTLAAASPTFAQDWTAEALGQNEGRIYKQTGKIDAGAIRAVTLSEIEASCSCKLSERTDGSTKDRVEFGLSTLWIDAYDLSKTKHNSTAHFYGDGETEHGSRKIMAGFYDTNGEPELRVYMTEPEQFSLAKAKTALSALGAAGATQTVKAETSRPKTSRTSGTDLLAGVKRDMNKLSKTKPAPKSLNTRKSSSAGAALLAGIKRDVEGPSKRRAAKYAVEAEAAEIQAAANRKIAAKNALRSNGYPVPLVMEKDSKTMVYNWVDTGNGTLVARANDPASPRIITAPLAYNLTTSDAALLTPLLKRQGLSRITLGRAERLDVSQKLLGKHSVILGGTAKRGRQGVRLFISVTYDPRKTNTNARVRIYEAAPQQWRDFGGIAVPMSTLSVYSSSI